MKKIFFILSMALIIPSVSLLARGGGREGGGEYHGNDRGYDNRGNNYNHGYDNRGDSYEHHNYGYEGGYYGGGAGVVYDPNYQSDPGEPDDTDALYQSYLQSNPPIPQEP